MPKKSRVETILPAIGNLTAEECSKLKQALKARESQVEGSVVLQKRAENVKGCPHCGSVSFQKWRRYKGNQRFRSQQCTKTFRTLAKAMEIELRCVPANPKKKRKGEAYQIQNVIAFDSRLKGWMFRFHGVAAKNLPSYLGWHRYLDVPKTRPTPRKLLAGALGDTLP